MIRATATLCITFLLFTGQAASGKTRFITAALPLTPAASSSAVSPCSLANKFVMMHTQIVQLAQEGNDAGLTSTGLHHRSSSRAYKRVEQETAEVNDRGEAILDSLAYLPVLLENAPSQGGKKDAALTLATTYRDAVEGILSYVAMAVYYERAENSVSMNDFSLAHTFNFGVSKANTKATGDTYARAMFDAKATAVRDAVRSIILPEYRYQMFCKMSFSPNATKRQAFAMF